MKKIFTVLAAMALIVLMACSGGGGSDPPPVSSVPKLLSVTPSQNSAIATGILGSFQIDFHFKDLARDLDGGTFCMDWGGEIISIPLDSSFAGIPEGYCSILFSLFQIPSVVGNITVQCWLTDKSGHESDRTSFLFSQAAPHWPWQWGTNGNDSGVGIVVDSQDRILVVGNADVPIGQRGAFVAEYLSDASCNGLLPLETKTGKAVAVDSANNIFTTGEKSVYTDISASMYDQHGNPIWEKTLSSTDVIYAAGIAVDGDGNVYVTGHSWGGVDGNIKLGNWGYDVFLTKYDASGNKQWTRQFGAPGCESTAQGIAIDSANNVYIIGKTDGPLDGQPYIGNSFSTFLVQFDSSGNRTWTKLFAKPTDFGGTGIVIDNSDNIYVTGSVYDGDLNVGASIGFIAKYNTSGDLQWMKMLGGQSWWTEPAAITLDHNNNIVITGAAAGAADSDLPTAFVDAFIAKYDSDGNQKWLTLLATPSSDYGYSVAVDSNNYIYVTGKTNGSLPGYSNAGYDDIFIAKFSTNGVLQGVGADLAPGKVRSSLTLKSQFIMKLK